MIKEELYSTTEAANIFRVSRKTVFLWIKKEKLKATKVGRNFVIPHSSIIEKLGKTLGIEKRPKLKKLLIKQQKTMNKHLKCLEKNETKTTKHSGGRVYSVPFSGKIYDMERTNS